MGRPQSEESKQKIRETLKKLYSSGERQSPKGMQGKKHSAEAIEKMRASALKRMDEGADYLFTKGHNKSWGEAHSQYNPDNTNYDAVHIWVRRRMGKVTVCEHCGKEARIDLANKSGEYSRDLSDWMNLCRQCHVNYDRKYGIRRHPRFIK